MKNKSYLRLECFFYLYLLRKKILLGCIKFWFWMLKKELVYVEG